MLAIHDKCRLFFLQDMYTLVANIMNRMNPDQTSPLHARILTVLSEGSNFDNLFIFS